MSNAGALRWCAMGNHLTPREAFEERPNGPARDCRACQERRLPPALGVDIDAIHWKLGAVRKGYKRP